MTPGPCGRRRLVRFSAPQGGEAGGGFALIPTRSHISGDLDRDVSLLAVPLIGLANLSAD